MNAKHSLNTSANLLNNARKGVNTVVGLMSGDNVAKASSGLEKRELRFALEKARQAVFVLEELYAEMK